MREAKALLGEEFPEGAWVSLAPGYRGLEVERTYGGVRQRWVLVELSLIHISEPTRPY